MTVKELKAMAKAQGVKGWYRMRKAELEAAIQATEPVKAAAMEAPEEKAVKVVETKKEGTKMTGAMRAIELCAQHAQHKTLIEAFEPMLGKLKEGTLRCEFYDLEEKPTEAVYMDFLRRRLAEIGAPVDEVIERLEEMGAKAEKCLEERVEHGFVISSTDGRNYEAEDNAWKERLREIWVLMGGIGSGKTLPELKTEAEKEAAEIESRPTMKFEFKTVSSGSDVVIEASCKTTVSESKSYGTGEHFLQFDARAVVYVNGKEAIRDSDLNPEIHWAPVFIDDGIIRVYRFPDEAKGNYFVTFGRKHVIMPASVVEGYKTWLKKLIEAGYTPEAKAFRDGEELEELMDDIERAKKQEWLPETEAEAEERRGLIRDFNRDESREFEPVRFYSAEGLAKMEARLKELAQGYIRSYLGGMKPCADLLVQIMKDIDGNGDVYRDFKPIENGWVRVCDTVSFQGKSYSTPWRDYTLSPVRDDDLPDLWRTEIAPCYWAVLEAIAMAKMHR